MESVIEPSIPIIDCHHHLWDGALRAGDIEVIVGAYDAESLLADIGSGHNVVATVAVESFSHYRQDHPSGFPAVGETDLAAAVGERHPKLCAAIVAWADLRAQDSDRAIAAHCESSGKVRAIRHSAAWDSDPTLARPLLAATTAPRMLYDENFRASVARLGRQNLVFETFIYHPQLVEVADLAHALPDVTMVIDHVGMPLGSGRYRGRASAVWEDWSTGIRAIAQTPNVMLKLGGLTMLATATGAEACAGTGSAELAEQMGPWLRYAIDALGPERCMFESNFPVEKATCDYRVLWNAFKLVARGYGDIAARAMLAENAARIYGIDFDRA